MVRPSLLNPLVPGLLLGTALALPGLAQDDPAPFEPETLTVMESIPEGPNVFSNDQSWTGAGSFNVWSAEDLSFRGNLTTGSMAQMLIAPGGETAYGLSTFMRRYTYGEIEHVLMVYDVATLSVTSEIALPPKAVMVAAYEPYLEISADGRFVFVLNATPATSVTVVDIEAGAVVQEVPIPGCFGIYPKLEGNGFSTVCGDGTLASFDIGADGTEATRTASEQFFDADENPVFIAAKRIGDDLGFLTYGGDLLLVSDAEDTAELVDTISLVEGVEDAWAPGGYDLFDYSPTADVLFVAMHSEPYDGSHKNASEEIWAYDVSEGELLYRTHVEGVISLTATDEAAPTIYAANEHDSTLMMFSTDPEAKFVLKLEDEVDSRGWATVVVVPE